MRIFKKTIGTIWLMFLLLAAAFGQSGLVLENGVTPHKGIDRIYKEFSLGYATLDAPKVAGLYSSDASYVPPSSQTVNGRRAILENFESFFSNVKQRGQEMTISFRVEKRKISKNTGYDIGVFEIEFLKDGAAVGNSKGRFVVVTVKEADGRWRFDVDAYTPLEND